MAIVWRAKYTRAPEKFRGDGAPLASRRLKISRARVYFARPTIAIAKSKDYSQPIVSNTHRVLMSMDGENGGF